MYLYLSKNSKKTAPSLKLLKDELCCCADLILSPLASFPNNTFIYNLIFREGMSFYWDFDIIAKRIFWNGWDGDKV